mgnify:FL=1
MKFNWLQLYSIKKKLTQFNFQPLNFRPLNFRPLNFRPLGGRSSHLSIVKQGYFTHLKDSMYYSSISLKCAILFFIHAIIPDLFTDTSKNVKQLNDMINVKYINTR